MRVPLTRPSRALRRNLLLALAAASLAATVPALSAQATSPRRNGEIAFTRYRLQNSPLWSEIYVARPDGSGVHRVSHSPTAVEDDQAQWSPNGGWIAFARCTSSRPCSVWLVRPDGSDQHRVTPFCHSARSTVCIDDSSPSFAPDGRHIVLTRAWGRLKHTSLGDEIEHSAIATVDLEGKHPVILRRLALYAGDLQSPRISPNGKLVVFDRYNASSVQPAGADALFVADVHGGPARQLTSWRLSAGSPAWSPDGRELMFKRFVAGGELAPGSNLYAIGVDGSGLRRVTDLGGNHYVLAGSFSSDGTSIVFATDRSGAPNPRGGRFADVFTMRLGTDLQVPVTRTANLDGWPSWGPAD
jgi:Tol biopolymer transport system component